MGMDMDMASYKLERDIWALLKSRQEFEQTIRYATIRYTYSQSLSGTGDVVPLLLYSLSILYLLLVYLSSHGSKRFFSPVPVLFFFLFSFLFTCQVERGGALR